MSVVSATTEYAAREPRRPTAPTATRRGRAKNRGERSPDRCRRDSRTELTTVGAAEGGTGYDDFVLRYA
eukprot:6757886-Prymnesium_polylepis.1